MAFCQKCGAQLADGAAFCANCGTPVGSTGTENQRRQVYEGEIRKCPNCGAVLNAFEAVCPSCGFEIRNAHVSSVVKEFEKQLAEIESTRKDSDTKGGNFIADIFDSMSYGKVSKTDNLKANFIKNFPVANTKEDAFEFMILAASNIDERVLANDISFDMSGNSERKSRLAIADAWFIKFEQVYQKAKFSFGNDPDFNKIQDIYDSKKHNIVEAKKRPRKSIIKIVIGFVSFYVILFSWLGIDYFLKYNENERLETIVLEIEEDIAKENFSSALLKANRLHFEKSDDEKKKHWDETRESLLQLIETERERIGK